VVLLNRAHGKVFALEVAEVQEGLLASHLDYKKQSRHRQGQEVHWHVVLDGLRRGERFGPFMQVGARENEHRESRHQEKRRYVVYASLLTLAGDLLVTFKTG
jgi:hypothetical protein